MGARNTAMGQAVTAADGDLWAMFGNPAAVDDSRKTVGFYAIRYYQLSELTDVSTVVNLPTDFGVLSVGGHRFGFDLYSENRFGAAFAKKWESISVGVSSYYHHVAIGGDYGSAGTMLLNVGMLSSISERWKIGFRAFNLLDSRLGESGAELAREIALGLGFQPHERVLFQTDAVKDVRYPLSVRMGAELWLLEFIALRAGVTTQPNTMSLGFGIKRGNLTANLVAQRHEEPALGLSPGLDLSWSW